MTPTQARSYLTPAVLFMPGGNPLTDSKVRALVNFMAHALPAGRFSSSGRGRDQAFE